MKVVLCGPPHSGKSCLREALKEAVLTLKRQNNKIPYPYVMTACPDGEGSWFQATAKRDPKLANKLKSEQKSEFSWEKALHYATEVQGCKEDLVIIDIGGRIDCKNEAICQSATHSILLYKTEKDAIEWRVFCEKLGLAMLAEFLSVQGQCPENGKHEQRTEGDGVFKGCLNNLERGDDTISERDIVQKFVERLLETYDAERRKNDNI